jgi:hypothetical protein
MQPVCKGWCRRADAKLTTKGQAAMSACPYYPLKKLGYETFREFNKRRKSEVTA